MTDAELIALVQEKAPEDLTDDEIAQLRARLDVSSELRAAIFDQLNLEQSLSQALGRVQVSADAIFASALSTDKRPNRTAALLGWVSCAGVILIAVAVWLLVSRDKPQVVEKKPQNDPVATGQEVAADDSAKQKSKPTNTSEKPADVPAGQQTTASTKTPAATNPRATEPAATTHPDKPLPVVPVEAPPATKTPAEQLAEAWPELFQKNGDPQPFAASSFAENDAEKRGLTQAELKRWLAPVGEEKQRFFEQNRGGGTIPVAGFEGLLQLQAPWPNDAVLYLSPYDHHGLTLSFWNGTEGISLHYYQYPQPTWAAYRVRSEATPPRPVAYALAATDNERYTRSGQGPIEIRHQQGALVLSRGDVRLLTAPLASPPSEVYFEKRATLRALTMYRGQPLPDNLPMPADNVLASETPAELEWTTHLPKGASFNKSANEWVELITERTTEIAYAAVRIPPPSLHEVILEVEGVTPGSGVYLGDETGKPLYRVGFLREQRTSWTMLGNIPPNRTDYEGGGDVNAQVVPFVGERQWLRLVMGAGHLKCWTSGDGTHWSRALDPQRQLRGAYSTVGLFCAKSDNRLTQPRRIALRRIMVRELTTVTTLVDGELLDRVPNSLAVVSREIDVATWSGNVLRNQPEGVGTTDWLHACAIRTLAAVPGSKLGNQLWDGLLADRLEQSTPVESRLRLLNQVAELYDTWEQRDSYEFSQFYEKWGRQLVREGNVRPYSIAGQALISAPFWTTAQFQVMPDSLVRAELAGLAYTEQWVEVDALCDRLRFWNRVSDPDARWPDQRAGVRELVEWWHGASQRTTSDSSRTARDRRRRDPRSPALAANGRHPLVVELSKEGFNTLAEMWSALAEESYRDACQIISSASPDLALGLVPAAKDSKLLVSLPQAVAAAMQEHPPLRNTMVTEFGKLGKLRVQQAISDNDPMAIEAVTVQFLGTEAAAEAHLWMGDRELSGGEFALAVGEYEQGLRSATPVQKSALAARLRLASAMLGREFGAPVTEPVEFHGQTLSAADFEKLVIEMKQKPSSSTALRASTSESQSSSLAISPRPARYEAHVRARYQTPPVNPPDNARSNIDWTARQLGWSASESTLYVSNRFQVTALDLAGGQVNWSESLGSEQGEANRWPLVPMSPVVAGERLFVRRLTRSGPELACLDTTTGKVQWRARPGDHVASDPLLIQDDLYSFTVSSPRDGMLQLELSTFNPLTGDVISQRPLIQLLDAWDRQVTCTATAVNGGLVAVVGGSVLKCDLLGQPLWVRRQTWLPPSADAMYLEQQRSAPLASETTLYVIQPGVMSVEAIEIDTGRSLWQRVVPEARRLLGLVDSTVLVETKAGWQGLNSQSGEILWYHDEPQMLDGQLSPTTGDVLVTRREQIKADQWRPTLVWLNRQTGKETAHWPLDSLSDKQPLLGPLFVYQDRVWAFCSRGDKDPSRELIELIPAKGEPLTPRSTGGPLEHWVARNSAR